MPPKKKPKTSSAYEHFHLTSDGKHYVCQCTVGEEDGDEETVCENKISAYTTEDTSIAPSRVSNLKRHLQRHHPNIYEKVVEVDANNNSKKEQVKSSALSKITKFVTSDKVTITMTPENFKMYIIQMVVNNSIPLSFFSKPAFKGMNGEIAAKYGISLDKDNVRKLVTDKAKKEKENLRQELKGKLVFLKMDGATRHRVNYFAINVRFVNSKAEATTKTLVIKDTKSHHESEYLQELVEDVLKDFGIKKDQVLCIVTDNATNMVCMVDKLNDDEDDENDIFEDDEIEEGEFIHGAEVSPFIELMRCGIHTLQLAIRDGLAANHAATFLAKLKQ